MEEEPKTKTMEPKTKTMEPKTKTMEPKTKTMEWNELDALDELDESRESRELREAVSRELREAALREEKEKEEKAMEAAPRCYIHAENKQGVDIHKVGLQSLENLHLDPGFALSKNTEQGQYMTTAAGTPVKGTGIHQEGEPSGAIVNENTWCFEISNKTDYLESGSILQYPMEVFVPARSLSMEEHSKLKVNVKQMIDHNDPPPSLPGNRQLGPIIRLEADQAHIQFARPLLVFIRFPEEFLKHTDDYEYCVQYNSGKDIHRGIWNDITGYREGQVSGEVIPSHQTAVLLLDHFSLFTIFRRCKLLNLELHAYHLQHQDTHKVLVTCLVYLKPLHGTAEYKVELDSIKGQRQTSEPMAVSKNDKVKEVVLVGHQDDPWHLEGLRTQIIQMQPLLENHFMKKHFYFQGQGQYSFSCSIEANIPGCTANPRILMPLQERDQAVEGPSAEYGNSATCDSGRSVQPVRNTKSLSESISPSFVQHLSPSERADLSERDMSDAIKKRIKEVLNSNRADLAQTLSVDALLWNCLIQNGVFSMNKRDDLKIHAQYDQATGIIDWVHHRPHSYEAFRKSLRDSGQEHVVKEYLPPVRKSPNGEP